MLQDRDNALKEIIPPKGSYFCPLSVTSHKFQWHFLSQDHISANIANTLRGEFGPTFREILCKTLFYTFTCSDSTPNAEDASWNS